MAAEGWGCGRAAGAPPSPPLAPAAATVAGARCDSCRSPAMWRLYLLAAAAFGQLRKRLQHGALRGGWGSRIAGLPVLYNKRSSCQAPGQAARKRSAAGKVAPGTQHPQTGDRGASPMSESCALCREGDDGPNPHGSRAPPPPRHPDRPLPLPRSQLMQRHGPALDAHTPTPYELNGQHGSCTAPPIIGRAGGK